MCWSEEKIWKMTREEETWSLQHRVYCLKSNAAVKDQRTQKGRREEEKKGSEVKTAIFVVSRKPELKERIRVTPRKKKCNAKWKSMFRNTLYAAVGWRRRFLSEVTGTHEGYSSSLCNDWLQEWLITVLLSQISVFSVWRHLQSLSLSLCSAKWMFPFVSKTQRSSLEGGNKRLEMTMPKLRETTTMWP